MQRRSVMMPFSIPRTSKRFVVKVGFPDGAGDADDLGTFHRGGEDMADGQAAFLGQGSDIGGPHAAARNGHAADSWSARMEPVRAPQ